MLYTSSCRKSTAARCALALSGQLGGGSHLMKTKSMSDSICLERCCTSMLPFTLDDPKTAESIGELLIDLCNRRTIGNVKVGLRMPRSLPIICCNFTIASLKACRGN